MDVMSSLKDYWNQASGDVGEWTKEWDVSNDIAKAELQVFSAAEGDDARKELKDYGPIKFFLNPKTVKVTKNVEMDRGETPDATQPTRVAQAKPLELSIGDLWFDCYLERENVRDKYIKKLEKLCDRYGESHHPPIVRLIWGDFLTETDAFEFYLKSLGVEYTMFLPNGMPVRAKVTMTFEEVVHIQTQQERNPNNSPDHAKLYTVKRGDTLQGIAMDEYDDPREWRRIAESNDIDDPLALSPGTKLLVPPILK